MTNATDFADIWERNADRFPLALAQAHGPVERTWSEFDRRADGVAAVMLASGVGQQDKVAQYMYNCSEYLELVRESAIRMR